MLFTVNVIKFGGERLEQDGEAAADTGEGWRAGGDRLFPDALSGAEKFPKWKDIPATGRNTVRTQ